MMVAVWVSCWKVVCTNFFYSSVCLCAHLFFCACLHMYVYTRVCVYVDVVVVSLVYVCVWSHDCMRVCMSVYVLVRVWLYLDEDRHKSMEWPHFHPSLSVRPHNVSWINCRALSAPQVPGMLGHVPILLTVRNRCFVTHLRHRHLQMALLSYGGKRGKTFVDPKQTLFWVKSLDSPGGKLWETMQGTPLHSQKWISFVVMEQQPDWAGLKQRNPYGKTDEHGC